MPIREARTPSFEGTETTDWSSVSKTLRNFIDGYFKFNPDASRPEDQIDTVDELPAAAKRWISARTLNGDPEADTTDELLVLPVVNPNTNRLNANAVRNAISRAPQTDGIDAESAQRVGRRLLDQEFGNENTSDLVGPDGTIEAAGDTFTGKDGEPHRVFERDIIRTGNFIHPHTGQKIPVDRNRLNHWVGQFQKYTEAGNDVYVPLHTHRGENGGWVKEMRVEGDRLRARIEAVGDDAIKAVARNRVSVGIHPEYTDGQLNTFSDFIYHVAVVPNPVVSGLGDSEAVAASGERPDTRYYLPENTEAHEMDLTELQNKLGISDELTEDNLSEKVGEKLTELQNRVQKLEAEKDEAEQAKQRAEKKAQSLEAQQTQLSADARFYATDSTNRRLDQLVSDGKITANVKAKLRPILQGSDVFLAAGEGGTAPLAHQIAEALQENDVTELGEKTGVQVLSREPDDDGKDDAELQQKATERMLKMAGVGDRK